MRSFRPNRILLPVGSLALASVWVGLLSGCQPVSSDPNPQVVQPIDTTKTGPKDSVKSNTEDKATLRLITPSRGQTYKLGDSLHVRAETESNGQGTINAVDIFLSADGGNTWGPITDRSVTLDSQGLVDFSWKIPTFFTANGKIFSLPENGRCMIRIAQRNTRDSLKISVSGNFMIEDTMFIRLTYPLGGESFKVGDTMHITWITKLDSPDPIDAVDVMVTSDSGKTWGYLRTSSILPESPNWERFPWIVTDSISILGKKTNLVDNPGVCIRVDQYSSSDPKARFQSGMISISRP